jgi:hypothetical protein
MTILFFLLLLAVLPWPWMKPVWEWYLRTCWKSSCLKISVEAGKKKLQSYKDKKATEVNKPKEGDGVK